MTGHPKVVVSSGWWSGHTPHAWQVGDPATTGPAFFELWYRQVRRYIDPAEIVIIDSASPVKPRRKVREAVTWIELDRNYGHANDIRVGLSRTRYSGGSRSRILGCAYALCSDADIYVHLEQDCLLRGERILEAALDGTTHPVVIGAPPISGRNALDAGIPAAAVHQNSLMIVRREGLERFLAGLVAGSETDGELPPEVKITRDCAPFDQLAIPFGRSRPIDFSLAHFYAQHLSGEELAEFCALEGVKVPRRSQRTPGRLSWRPASD
jgi:hypothetical protein